MKYPSALKIFCAYLLLTFSFASEVEVTLISPEPGEAVKHREVQLEGLVNDYSVSEIKVLLNDQEVRFLPVRNGFFSGTLHFDQRRNRLTLYGATADRRYFRREFQFINQLEREKSLEERVPPEIFLSGFTQDRFQILSPRQYSELSVRVQDNNDSIVQSGYVLNDQEPVYLKWNKGLIPLNLEKQYGKSSYNLHIFAIDGDGNKTTANFHFRVEPLECELSIGPGIGLYETVPVEFHAKVKGGLGDLKMHYELSDGKGRRKEKSSARVTERIYLKDFDLPGVFRGSLRVVDSNGIDVVCQSKEEVLFYSSRHPRKLKVAAPIHFESIQQNLQFEVIPPNKGGELTLLLKEHDPQSGFTGQVWKTLGRKSLRSKAYQKDWKVRFERRVPPGDYLMKLSFAIQGKGLDFTETIPVVVTRSKDDTVDLLEEILRDELE